MSALENLKKGLMAVQWKSLACGFVLFLAVVLVIQWRTGAFQGEFGSEPDEAAHYVTGLVIRDYVAAGFPGNPMHYARDYYEHYPKVALGHWPPVFYLVQSAWTLVFSPSRVSVMVLMAVLTAMAATVFSHLLKADFGCGRAVAGALLFLAFPMVQQFSGAIMTEIPITLFSLLAIVFFIRYLEHERTEDSVIFGLLATVAILTKYSGFALALVPPLAVVFSRRFYLVKRLAFWLPAVLVGVLAGPWVVATRKIASDGVAEDPFGRAFTSKAIPYYATHLVAVVGVGILILAVFGFAIKLLSREKAKPSYATFGGLLLGILFLHVVIPAGYEARHMIPAIPAVIFFAWAGCDWLAGWLAGRGLNLKAAMAVTYGLAFVLFFTGVFQMTHKGYAGFAPVAEKLLQESPAKEGAFLVCSDARGEGMFISEVAMHEKRPGHFVLRASKKLAGANWNGGGYKMIYTAKASDKTGQEYTNADQLYALLAKDSIRYFVVDDSVPEKLRPLHQQVLRQALDSHPESFALDGTYPIERKSVVFPDGLRVYESKLSH